VAVLGSNTQTMSTFVSTQNLMMGLLGSHVGPDAVAQAVVAAAYRTFKAVDSTNASKTLTAKDNLVSLYTATYEALTGAAVSAPGRHLLQSALSSAQLQSIFGAVANVVSSTNQEVQQVVNTASAAAADPTTTVDTSNLMVTVSKMATVQQQSLASDIGTLATQYAADPTTNIATLQEVSSMAVMTLHDLLKAAMDSPNHHSANYAVFWAVEFAWLLIATTADRCSAYYQVQFCCLLYITHTTLLLHALCMCSPIAAKLWLPSWQLCQLTCLQ
jgi:hypothetical protein